MNPTIVTGYTVALSLYSVYFIFTKERGYFASAFIASLIAGGMLIFCK